MYKFSVIIACYNSKDKLSKTIESVIKQDIKEVQIIIIDGGSTDNSNEIFNNFKNNINILISEKDYGIADAWNKGLKYVEGEFVNFLNAGDFYEENMLGRIYSNCIKYKENFIGFGNTTLFDINSKELIIGKFNKKNIFLLNGFSFMHPSVFFPANLIDKVGAFNLNKRIAIDTDWLLRCITCKVDFHDIKSHVYMEKGGLSNKFNYAAMGEYLDSLVSLKFPVYYIPLFFVARLLGSFKILFHKNSFKQC